MCTHPRQETRIGHFEIVDVLGSGGFATVYRAHDNALRRDVALKLLHAHLATDPQTVRRFQAEARSAAGLRHPNIVTVYEAGETDTGHPYLVMELLEGETLATSLADAGPLSLHDTSAILDQIAAALEYLHARGIVHRDLKPSNVMVDADGRVTLMDFGSARELNDQTRRTATGELLGTLSFMAPEQITGDPITPATDVYALGLLTFQMLTGTLPFTGATATILYDQVNRPAPPIRRFRPDVPIPVETAIAAALAKSPAERPPSALALARRVAASLAAPSAAPTATMPRHNPVPVPPERLTAPISTSGTLPLPARARPYAAADQPRRSVALAWITAGGMLLALIAAVWLGLSAISGRSNQPPPHPAPPPVRAASTAAAAVRASATVTPSAGPRTSPRPSATPQAERTVPPAPAATAAVTAVAALPRGCATSVTGAWQFTDLIQAGAGLGQRFTFAVYLTQDGDAVTGSGEVSLSGRLNGCELLATFNEPGGDGSFDWIFNADGTGFNGSFLALSFGNSGQSTGQRVSP